MTCNSNKVAGREESNGEAGKSNGNGNEDCVRAAATMMMAAASMRAMAMVTRWWATKRVIARVARAMATAISMVGDKEGNGKGNKSNGNGNEGGE